ILLTGDGVVHLEEKNAKELIKSHEEWLEEQIDKDRETRSAQRKKNRQSREQMKRDAEG
ncbi:hypothetical protein MKW92_027507, partial [Papaver armeniacum]